MPRKTPKTLTRREITEVVSRNAPHLTKSKVGEIVRDSLDTITRHLSMGNPVELRGLGSFRVTTRAGRTGRNPRTGEKVIIPAKRVVKYRQSKEIILTVA